MATLLGFLVFVLILIIVIIALRALFSKLTLDPAVQTVIWCIVAVIVLLILWNTYGAGLSNAKLPR